MQVSKNFHIKEFVPVEIFQRWGSRSIWFVDPKLIELVQVIRDKFGPTTINGGSYNMSGFRPMTTSVGGKLSQHRFGRAADLKFEDYSPQEVYRAILEDEAYWMGKGLTTLENISATPTWLHVDIRPTGLNNILIVNP